MHPLLVEEAWVAYLFLGASLGAVFASFANVLLYRLPRIAGLENTPSLPDAIPLGLSRPGSLCPLCHHPLRWYELLPLLSFVLQQGRCRHCQQNIAKHYPGVELAGAIAGAFILTYLGVGLESVALLILVQGLAVMAVLDIRYYLLPNCLTQPLLWMGLALAVLGQGWAGSLQEAVWGALLGYGLLAATQALYILWRGHAGLGEGDMHLLALLGAWAGVTAILPGVILACGMGILWAGGRTLWLRRYTPGHSLSPSSQAQKEIITRGLPHGALAFGPFLMVGVGLAWLLTQQWSAWWMG